MSGSQADTRPSEIEEGTLANTQMKLFKLVVVGMGIAGRVRVRDIPSCAAVTQGLQHVNLAGFVSRSSVADVTGVPQLTLDEVLQENNDIKAVIISTENARHEELARRALEAKKHVLVDYPLSRTATAAKQLLALAEQNNLVCYEEDIAQLTDQYQALRNLVKSQGPLDEATLSMTGGFNGWIEDFESSGSPWHCGINLLHALLDMFGDLTTHSAELHKTETSIVAQAVLQNKDQRLVKLSIQRGPSIRRSKKWRYVFSNGTVIDEQTTLEDLSEVNKDKPKALFMRDLLQFVSTVDGKRDHSHNQWLTIRALELADELYNLAKQNPKSEL